MTFYRYTDDEKMQIVAEHIHGASVQSLVEKYHLSCKNVLLAWIDKFVNEPNELYRITSILSYLVYSDKNNGACNVAPRKSAGKKWNNSYFAYNLVMQVQGENIGNGKILLMKGTKDDASDSGPIKMGQIMGILRVKFKRNEAKEAAKNDGVKYIFVELTEYPVGGL